MTQLEQKLMKNIKIYLFNANPQKNSNLSITEIGTVLMSILTLEQSAFLKKIANWLEDGELITFCEDKFSKFRL